MTQSLNADGSIKDTAIGGIQGRAISLAAPADNDVLTYNSATSQWEPAAAAGGAPNLTTTPTDDDGFGWRAPDTCNNHKVAVDSYCCQGFYYGMTTGDHLAAQRLLFVYCAGAFYVSGSGTFEHGNTILNLGIEACNRGFDVANTSGFSIPFFIGAMHTETLGGVDINDLGSRMTGLIYWHAISRTAPSVNGAGRVRIINERIGHGAITGTVSGIGLPAVPASTTPLTNPYWRDVAVAVAGGTVTNIAVEAKPPD